MGIWAPAPLVAVLTSLGVAAVVVARRAWGPGVRPLVAMCVAIGVWHVGDFMLVTTHVRRWQVLSAIGSAALVPPLIHFLLATVGRRMPRWLAALYLVTALLLAVSAVGFVRHDFYRFVVSVRWGAIWAVLYLPPLVISLALLARSVRSASDPDLRARSRGVLFGVAVAVPAGLFDLAALAHPGIPMLGSFGTIVGTLALAWSVDVGAEPGRALATRSALLVVAVTAAAVLLTVAIWSMTEGGPGAVLAAGSGTALAAVAAFRYGSARLQREAMRMQSLALLGTFAAEVAHEVRNPLAAIRGSVQLLLKKSARGADPASFQEYLRLIDEEVERLDGVVTDYHALARVNSDRSEHASVAQVIRDLVTLHGPVVPANIEVRTELDDALPRVRADTGRLRQALLNLVRNALIAMPRGGTLTLRACAERSGASVPTVLVEVEDTGVGIPERELGQVFQPLYTRRAGGSGLGLAVAQRIAHEHGGAIRVRSRPGYGTTFTLALPAEAG